MTDTFKLVFSENFFNSIYKKAIPELFQKVNDFTAPNLNNITLEILSEELLSFLFTLEDVNFHSVNIDQDRPFLVKIKENNTISL